MLKIDLRKTVIVTAIMLMITLLINILPFMTIFIAPFLLLPTAYLYYKSRNSYYVMSLIIVIVNVMMSILTMQIMLGAIFAGYIIGQLLVERTSKERMLYILTVYYSIYVLVSIIFLQVTDFLPKVQTWFEPTVNIYNDILSKGIKDGTIPEHQLEMFNQNIDIVMQQVPGIVVFVLFILTLLQLVITLPLLRQYKIATPNFRPLYAWQMPKALLYIYLIVLLAHFGISETDYIPFGIVINLRYIIEWLLFIQGLSLMHYFMKLKRTHPLLNIFIFILAFISAPISQLFGLIDLMVNLKKRIPRKLK
ncbi:DUF2232 domain-containing protein [Macrococcoides caseolyticum]|uniref:DUF2232 domain-containing protein n=1 Tax=Macrococcoides caseolyticum TaxID=69966 RepID=UPI001F420235|nr:DUF2232 domain-containing protein [Macrococcus caseolyticus]MCE4956679.1 DUF2232 domain-containing protein [Macrococcus caseolyticus]